MTSSETDKFKDNISSSNDTSKIDTPVDAQIDKIDSTHVVDLSTVHTNRMLPDGYKEIPLLYPSISYLNYFRRAVQHLILTIIFDWTTFITQPVNFLLNFVFFPLVAVVLFFLEIILNLVS